MQHQSFDMNLLKVLAVLFEERSVTRTGERLGRTQSAISNSLRNLREALNDPLLVRGPDGLVPTPRARLLEEKIRTIIRMTESCLTEDEAFDPSSAGGRFQIGAPDRLSLPVMLPLFKTLRRMAPGIDIDLITADRERALDMLDAERLTLAVGWFDRPPPRFNAAFLFQERLVCLCRRDHPVLAKRGPVALRTILAYPHLVVSAADDRKAAFDMMLARTGERRHAAVSVTNFTAVPRLLRDNELVGVYTERVAAVLAREYGFATRPLSAEIEPLDHYMVWHSRDAADRKHAWLRDQVLAACNG